MAQDIVGGLFGVTPEMYQQQRQQAQLKEAIAMGQLSPEQFVTTQAYRAGQSAGNVLGGLLGAEDPQLQMIRDVQSMRTQFDVSNPQGLRQFAQALSQKGYTDLAMQASAKAADIDKELSQAEKNRMEKLPPIAQLQAYRDRLIQVVGPNDPRVKEVNAVIEGEGKKGQTTVNLGGLADLFAKKEYETSAAETTKAITAAQEALKTNSKVSRDIAEIEKILPNSFTGKFANFSKDASKTFAALGVPISEKASNTEALQALTNNLVLPAVKQLPGSLAAKELAFLQQTKPEALQEPATIKRLVNMIKDDISVNRALVKRADAYKKQDRLGTLNGFNIALQQDEIYTNLRRYNDLKSRVNAGQKITQQEADFAKSVEQELGL